MVIVEIVVVPLGWGAHLQGFRLPVLGNVLAELGYPIVLDIEVYY